MDHLGPVWKHLRPEQRTKAPDVSAPLCGHDRAHGAGHVQTKICAEGHVTPCSSISSPANCLEWGFSIRTVSPGLGPSCALHGAKQPPWPPPG